MYYTHLGYQTSIFGKNRAYYIRIFTVREPAVTWKKLLIAVRMWHVCQGYKEVTLLGQNVNSYRDTSTTSVAAATTATSAASASLSSASSSSSCSSSSSSELSAGFETVYRARRGGLRFSDLLSRVADVNPQMRVRFTSPHPKDFPDDVNAPLHSAGVYTVTDSAL